MTYIISGTGNTRAGLRGGDLGAVALGPTAIATAPSAKQITSREVALESALRNMNAAAFAQANTTNGKAALTVSFSLPLSNVSKCVLKEFKARAATVTTANRTIDLKSNSGTSIALPKATVAETFGLPSNALGEGPSPLLIGGGIVAVLALVMLARR